MVDTFTTARRAVGTLSALSPELGARASLDAFLSTRPRMRVHPDDLPTHDDAIRASVTVRGRPVATYRWGRGDETVLLVHGWRGRASQFAPLVRELVYEKFQVIAFDAPGHGDSQGRHTDVRDWLTAIHALQREHGRFRLIVGHSFGAIAALTSVREGVTARSVATVAGAGSPVAYLDRFAGAMGLPPDGRARFERRFNERIGEDAASVAARYDAIAHPLPAAVELLVMHDASDAHLDASSSRLLADAHAPRSRFIASEGLGHARLLRSDLALDTVTAFACGGLAGVDRAVESRATNERDAVGNR